MMEKSRKFYINVIVIAVLAAWAFTTRIQSVVFEVSEAVGLGALEIHLLHGVLFGAAVTITTGLLSIGINFARRRLQPHSAWYNRFSYPAVLLFLAAGFVFIGALGSGIRFYFGPTPPVLMEFAAVASAIQGSIMFSTALGAVIGSSLSLLTTFANKDADDEGQDDEAQGAAVASGTT